MAAASACNARSPATAKKRTLQPPLLSESRRATSRPLRRYFFQGPGRRRRARVKDAGAPEMVESKRKLWPGSHRRLQGRRAVPVLMDNSILHFFLQNYCLRKQSSCEQGVDSRGKP